jgi:gas vesicle protein
MFFAQTPSPSGSTQTWAALITTVVGAVAAVLARKRFSGRAKSFSSSSSSSSSIKHVSHTDLQLALTATLDKLDSTHKEVMTAIADQSSTIEKRLDALESAVARLDERTKLTT